MAEALTAPPVIRRKKDGLLELVVAGHPVDGVVGIMTNCDSDGSFTQIIIHNSAVMFEVERNTEIETH